MKSNIAPADPMGSKGLFKWNPTNRKLESSGECPDTTPRSPAPGRRGFMAPWPLSRTATEKSRSKSILAMHKCCGKPLKIKFPVTAASCMSLLLAAAVHGRQVTSSAGLTVLSSKAGLGPMSLQGGTCHFLLRPSASSSQPLLWVGIHCHYF